jgi:hypothetical protein
VKKRQGKQNKKNLTKQPPPKKNLLKHSNKFLSLELKDLQAIEICKDTQNRKRNIKGNKVGHQAIWRAGSPREGWGGQ